MLLESFGWVNIHPYTCRIYTCIEHMLQESSVTTNSDDYKIRCCCFAVVVVVCSSKLLGESWRSIFVGLKDLLASCEEENPQR